MKKVKNQITKIYKRKGKEIDILIYYRMLLQRISRHLSPKEVSFLMGKPLDFISKVETFRIKKIFIQDVVVMHRALAVNSINSMMHLGEDISSKDNAYELHVTKLVDRVIYDMYKVDVEQDQKVKEFKLIDIRYDIDPSTNSTTDEVKKIETFLDEQIDVEQDQKVKEFKLIDIRYDIDPSTNSTTDEVKKIETFLDEQIDGGYFSEERLAYEIHNLCCEKLEKYIQPKNLMLVLDELLQGSEETRIVRHQTGYGFGYVLAAHAKSTEKK
ncbi:hypothetical protein [Sphingobacterium sp. BIGb0165]|uniref:hypothetical protein n=1 Tax=Sphingobacterium sp. BIGb0165 TaxID=2940615 RepID=UPI00216865D6|nr:hypothetical protein [Sphingobacterium sp. BIGb0165]MCS4228299.1 hypothetical protein [Sphingobacterium sp. BIGb0165]